MGKVKTFPRKGKIKGTGAIVTIVEPGYCAGIPTYVVRFGREKNEYEWARSKVVDLGEVDG